MTRQASSGKNGEEPAVKVPTAGGQRAEELRRRRGQGEGGATVMTVAMREGMRTMRGSLE